MEMFLSQSEPESSWLKRPWTLAAAAAAIVLIVAVIGVPWYTRGKAAKATNELKAATTLTQTSAPIAADPADAAPAESSTSQPATNSDAELAARKLVGVVSTFADVTTGNCSIHFLISPTSSSERGLCLAGGMCGSASLVRKV